MDSQPKLELLHAEADENDDSFVRLLVNGQSIKYVTIEPGLYLLEDLCFGSSLISLLPELPAGDWNDGLVAKNPRNGKPHFTSAVRTRFPGIKHQWHGTYVDYLDLKMGKRLRTGIYEATCFQFENAVVVAKFARFEWEIPYLENESTADPLKMCTQFFRMYTCGCRKTEEFQQCPERFGTNVKCSPVRWTESGASLHMCIKHMVKPGKDEMRR
ncbi:uncharacterized protein TRUGW13939_01582 [Talaromyces rugulosus]|uniref:Uncharacterized protein n=1 Tax=Talaromyces rugulosus TaxID=121627 RepID=A0A7H8QLS6_TALRU|nr:uncharacterized protein TRUGW13939_01582 [Talaromyces rugulosus]QKX54495.1 hypothetical protein TRUGW13939_01582 [Talaromyces rugulosus]